MRIPKGRLRRFSSRGCVNPCHGGHPSRPGPLPIASLGGQLRWTPQAYRGSFKRFERNHELSFNRQAITRRLFLFCSKWRVQVSAWLRGSRRADSVAVVNATTLILSDSFSALLRLLMVRSSLTRASFSARSRSRRAQCWGARQRRIIIFRFCCEVCWRRNGFE
ncbi:hypothetical protein LY78DRAFT_166563 [Colletotrichum sublineola]|nr:hypothetical protein LY78DRAFT_166563 [Colletotrichum sublineola]